MEQQKEYFAFISYKREDERWAKWLQHKLEHYHLPTNVRKDNPSLPQSIRPVFKDTSELAAGVLADEIHEALDNSKYLIVICSPRAAQSKWVGKEVQTFIDMGRFDKIIPFIIGGKPFSENPEEECFSSALLNLPKEQELLGVNINAMGRDAAVVKVIARMFGLKFDALWQRYEREQKRKSWMWIAGSILIALLGLSIGGYIANQNRELRVKNDEIKAERDRANSERDRANFERDRTKAARDSLRTANDSIGQQNMLIRQQRNDLDLSNKNLLLRNEQLAEEKQVVLSQYARLVAARAEEHIRDNDYLGARRMLLEVLPQKVGNNNYPYIPEVEQVLRKSFENSSCAINAHINSISDVAISPNSQYFVSCASQEDIKIWDSQSGLLTDSIRNSDYSPSLSFLSNGNLIVSKKDSVTIWELSPLKRVHSYKSKILRILDIDDSNRIVFVNSNKKNMSVINVADGLTGQLLSSIPTNSIGHITSAIFLPRNQIATASMYDSIKIWDITEKKCVREWKAHEYGVKFLHSNKEGTKLISGEFGKIGFSDPITTSDSLRIWDVKSGKLLNAFPISVQNAQFCSNGNRIIAAKGADLIILNSHNGELIKTISGHKNITNFEIGKWGNNLVSFSSDGIIRLWDEKMVGLITKQQIKTSNYSIPIAMHPSGNTFLISTGDSIMAFSTSPYKEIKRFGKNNRFKISSIRYSKDGNKFITADAIATLWNSRNYTSIGTIRSFRPVYAEISPDGSKALTVQGGNAIYIWDISKGESVISEHFAAFKSGIGSNKVNMASFSPNGKHIITANSDGIIRIWDINKQMCIDSLIGHKGSINTAFYNPQGNQIVSASSDKTIRIWNTKTHGSATLEGHADEVCFAEFSSDGKYVISSSLDNICKIWDAKTGISLKTEFSNNSWSVMNANKGMYITTDYPDGITLKFFPSFQELIKRVQCLFSK